MKKIFYMLFVMVFFATSCSKEETNKQLEEKLYPVQFSFMASDVVDFPTGKIGQTTNSNIIKSYYLYVYDNSGNLHANGKIEKTNVNEANPTLNINLPTGNYTAVILAFNDDVVGRPIKTENSLATASATSVRNGSILYEDPCEIYFKHNFSFTNYFYNDYFYKKVAFTVTSTTNNVDLTATRVTGRLELNIKDAAAKSDIGFVKMTLQNVPYGVKLTDGLQFNAGTSTVIYFTKQEWLNFANRNIVINCMPTATPKITLEFIKYCFDIPTVEYTKTITGFEVYTNKITRLSGNVYSNNSDFNMSIETNWSETVTGEF